ncbi:MAG: SDR family oxidoreductase [Ardenticatenales bacterium]|nr:SDR family oxidoreductase [Ardenticatenales bacterium]
MTSIFHPELFKDKIAFVTGGGSGINRGIVEAFLRHGMKVAISSRSQERLDKAATEMQEQTGSEVLAIAADVRQYDAVEAAINATVEHWGGIDVVVNGAAGNFMVPAAHMSANAFRTVIDIDLNGTFNVSRAAFATLEARQGNIINISAVQAAHPMPFQAHVGAAKAGIENLTRSLASEWGGRGIRVNAIVPGPIAGTEGVDRILGQFNLVEQVEGTIPLRRFGTVEEIGNCALFLASPAAAYITGAILVCDGGQHMVNYGPMLGVMRQVDPKL